MLLNNRIKFTTETIGSELIMSIRSQYSGNNAYKLEIYRTNENGDIYKPWYTTGSGSLLNGRIQGKLKINGTYFALRIKTVDGKISDVFDLTLMCTSKLFIDSSDGVKIEERTPKETNNSVSTEKIKFDTIINDQFFSSKEVYLIRII